MLSLRVPSAQKERQIDPRFFPPTLRFRCCEISLFPPRRQKKISLRLSSLEEETNRRICGRGGRRGEGGGGEGERRGSVRDSREGKKVFSASSLLIYGRLWNPLPLFLHPPPPPSSLRELTKREEWKKGRKRQGMVLISALILECMKGFFLLHLLLKKRNFFPFLLRNMYFFYL